jgi:hypothetical protein
VTTLRFGRSLTVEPLPEADVPEADVLELRDASGTLELRLKLTEDGVVLQVEGTRISLKAEQSIDLESKSINLIADGDIRVRGERVYIN